MNSFQKSYPDLEKPFLLDLSPLLKQHLNIPFVQLNFRYQERYANSTSKTTMEYQMRAIKLPKMDN